MLKARQHNTPPGAPDSVRNGYSSDACAVSAIWLIVMIWGSNTLRAWRPMELQDPMVAFSIFSSVTITRAGTFVTIDEGLAFITRLLKGFMIGFAIATGISLFVLPVTSRSNVFHDVKAYVAQVDAVLKSQIAFVEDGSEVLTGRRGLLSRTRTALSMRDAEHAAKSSIESKKKRLAESITKLNALHGKLQSDLFYSKDEIAWGKLSADDLSRIGGLLRSILLPLSGIAMLPEILDMIVQNEGPRQSAKGDDEDSGDEMCKNGEIQKVVEILQHRLEGSSALVAVGLQYVLLTLELMKSKQLGKQWKAKDEEVRGEEINPLQPDFVLRFEDAIREYYARRSQLPRALASIQAFSTTEKAGGDAVSEDNAIVVDSDVRQEFFIILYMGHLQENLLKAILDLVKFAEGKVTDGTMRRGRLIFPKQKSIREWLSPTSENKESTSVPDRRQSAAVGAADDIEPGTYPDPEHMAPENIWEKSSNVLRTISHVIKSEQSIFGFRVAAASISVGILAFLHQTQDFFIRQRCIWAMIVIVIGMNPTSGQTMFGFVARIVATVFALALSLVVWYIVDGKTPGVIIFLYIANVFGYYFWIKVPQYFGASVIAIVTLNVIIGYELQVRKLGIETATSNGQPYYPIYLFGPYKLAAVAAGCAISFVWVIFPYPITAKSTLRKALGRGLFVLAKFYSCMHTTVELWLSGTLGNVQDVTSASYKLETARHKVFKEEMMLLNQLRMHSHFSTFEPPIGGKFPKHVYDAIIAEIQRMLTSMALMAQTTQNLNAFAFDHCDSKDPENRWVSRLAEIALKSADFKSHATTSLLCHLSASILNAQPLPPYLSTGDSFPLARQLQRIDGELLSLRHVEDPAFSAFVSLEVLRSVLSFSLKDLLRYSSLNVSSSSVLTCSSNVKSLVGELAFDFHVRHTEGYAESTRLMAERSHED
ncbi:conserved hypothetical protein [Aspergillus terreus NIH2624]|uniref:Uncharacterized protein n=1 Tax=Aspergillus terreus (strain NIH 2624 / FGSC A1156) TaxID=341663 RepID=Q0CW00_ASPTN|nr:uncharacterized protein ATEG_02134 [Aspergillus terreus NIH2624]EAU37096.1 conserved hypothetical protein [Aspergillus terreus NIH2624]